MDPSRNVVTIIASSTSAQLPNMIYLLIDEKVGRVTNNRVSLRGVARLKAGTRESHFCVGAVRPYAVTGSGIWLGRGTSG